MVFRDTENVIERIDDGAEGSVHCVDEGMVRGYQGRVYVEYETTIDL